MTEIIEKLRAGTDRARQDSEYQAATRGLPCAIWLDDGEGQRVAAWTGQPAGPAQRIVVQAPQATWRKILSAAPPPGYHSFSAALRFAQGFSAKGDALALAQSLHPLERLFEILRGQVDAPAMRIDRRAIQGHYADIALPQGTASLYLETCGAGAPLLMLHTAGADARQYHGLMADPALRARWRMIAFDMPGHGRSAPLPGTAWTAADLRRDDYLAVCQAVIRQWVGAPVCCWAAPWARPWRFISPRAAPATWPAWSRWKRPSRRPAASAHCCATPRSTKPPTTPRTCAA